MGVGGIESDLTSSIDVIEQQITHSNTDIKEILHLDIWCISPTLFCRLSLSSFEGDS